LARLQHHLKYYATYGVFYQLVEDFEKQVPSNKIFKREFQKLSSIFHSKESSTFLPTISKVSAGIHVICRLGIIERAAKSSGE
jgi:hypothetical protein